MWKSLVLTPLLASVILAHPYPQAVSDADDCSDEFSILFADESTTVAATTITVDSTMTSLPFGRRNAAAATGMAIAPRQVAATTGMYT